MSTMTEKNRAQIAQSKIAGVSPVSKESELFSFSAGVASAIKILDARTQADETLTDAEAATFDEPEEQDEQKTSSVGASEIELDDTLSRHFMKADEMTLSATVSMLNAEEEEPTWESEGFTPTATNLIGVDENNVVGAAFPKNISWGNPAFVYRNDYKRGGVNKVGAMGMLETTFISDIKSSSGSVYNEGKYIASGMLRYVTENIDVYGKVVADRIVPFGVLCGDTFTNMTNVLVKGETSSEGEITYSEGFLVGRGNDIPYFTEGNGIAVVSGGTVQIIGGGTGTGIFTMSNGTLSYVEFPEGATSCLIGFDATGELELFGVKQVSASEQYDDE